MVSVFRRCSHRLGSLIDGVAAWRGLRGNLLLPALLVAPYLVYMVRGGIPKDLPAYMISTFAVVAGAAALLSERPAIRVFQSYSRLFLLAGTAAVAIAGCGFGYLWDPGARIPETYNFYEEMLDTMRGGFFMHPSENRTEFAIHFSPVLLAVYGIFRFLPFPATLFVATAIALAGAQLLARRFLLNRWSDREAALLSFGAVLFPSILSLYIGFSPVRFAPAAAWLVFHGYRSRSVTLAILGFVAAICVKETMMLALFMVSAMALLERRSIGWIILPATAATAAFLFINQIILPAAAQTPGQTSTIAAQFGYWGSTAPQVILAWIRDPGSFLDALLRLNNLAYLLKLGHPALFLLPLGSPLVLAALPEMLVNTIAGYDPRIIDPSRPGPWTSLVGHYSATIGAALWAASTETFSPARQAEESEQEFELRRWNRARLLFLSLLSAVVYPTNAESL